MYPPNIENIGHSLGVFISEFGVPEQMTVDNAAVQVGSKTILQNHVRNPKVSLEENKRKPI